MVQTPGSQGASDLAYQQAPGDQGWVTERSWGKPHAGQGLCVQETGVASSVVQLCTLSWAVTLGPEIQGTARRLQEIRELVTKALHQHCQFPTHQPEYHPGEGWLRGIQKAPCSPNTTTIGATKHA